MDKEDVGIRHTPPMLMATGLTYSVTMDLAGLTSRLSLVDVVVHRVVELKRAVTLHYQSMLLLKRRSLVQRVR